MSTGGLSHTKEPDDNINEIVHSTKYPRSRDPVADLKASLQNVIDLLEVKHIHP